VKGFRAPLLYFAGDGASQVPIFEADGLLVVDRARGDAAIVLDVGDFRNLIQRYPDLKVEHLPGRLIAPGFVDQHIHYPQLDVIGSPSEGLLPWLERYTFPHEARFSDSGYASGVAGFFLDELQRNGVTTALTFCTSHPPSVDALMLARSRAACG